jgi:AcrR family transcriptional regulator
MNNSLFMQYLKNEIREKIIAAALKEFKEHGYLEANMRSIARRSGITVGNIYRYFRSKDALLKEIMEPAKLELMDLLFADKQKGRHVQEHEYLFDIDSIMNNVIRVLRKYASELIIIIYESKGSKYENIKEEFISLIEKRLAEELLSGHSIQDSINKNSAIAYVMAASFVESVFIIVKKYDQDIEKIDFLIRQMIVLFFKDIHERLL